VPKADFAKAIASVEEMRQTHVDWLEHLKPDTLIKDRVSCAECERTGMASVVGDAKHHRSCIRRYDNVIRCLRAGGKDQ